MSGLVVAGKATRHDGGAAFAHSMLNHVLSALPILTIRKATTPLMTKHPIGLN